MEKILSFIYDNMDAVRHFKSSRASFMLSWNTILSKYQRYARKDINTQSTSPISTIPCFYLELRLFLPKKSTCLGVALPCSHRTGISATSNTREPLEMQICTVSMFGTRICCGIQLFMEDAHVVHSDLSSHTAELPANHA